MSWWIRNVREMPWRANELGATVDFDRGVERFDELGINLTVLEPGQPMTMYHQERYQEGFLLLRGEALLIVEGREVALKQWDYFHCPADTNHVMVATGDEPCVAIAVGSRASRDVVYPEFEPARRHGGAVQKETTDPKEASAGMDVRDAPYRDGWLPDL